SIPTPPPIVREYVVEHADHACQLDDFVSKAAGVRRGFARLKILNGEVHLVNSSHAKHFRVKPNGVLHAGDVVRVLFPGPKTKIADTTTKEKLNGKQDQEDEKRRNMELEQEMRKMVVYKDQHILVINKPSGMAVQDGSKVKTCLTELLPAMQFGKREPPQLVHRLDKDTTGALILARTKDAATRMSEIFRDAESDRIGKKVRSLHESDALTPNNRIKKAVTSYRLLSSKKHVSLLELRPLTGRKHQLRLHCADVLEAPVLGDYKYGVGCPAVLSKAFPNVKRVQIHLHLREISLKDWFGEGKHLTVTAPLPKHFEKTLQGMGMGIGIGGGVGGSKSKCDAEGRGGGGKDEGQAGK
ncbi:hypothetical protein HK101_003963, partial [Irineochytrium annulatum]